MHTLLLMKKIQRRRSQSAQTITEYILLVCLLAAGSIVVVTKLGNVIRAQLSAAAETISGTAASAKAKDQVKDINKHVSRGLDDFWKKNSSPESR